MLISFFYVMLGLQFSFLLITLTLQLHCSFTYFKLVREIKRLIKII